MHYQYLLFVIPAVYLLAIAYKALLRRRKARVKRRQDKDLVMAYEDHNRLILIIKRCKTQQELVDMQYEVDQFCLIYGDLIDVSHVNRLAGRMEDHIRIRRCMVRN